VTFDDQVFDGWDDVLGKRGDREMRITSDREGREGKVSP
jgi:hypothetical protein